MEKLCVFTLYPEKGASSRYRAFIFKDKLENDFEIKWFPFWNEAYVTKYMHNKKKYVLIIAIYYLIASVKRFFQLYFVAPKADVVFLQKATIPKMKKTFLGRIVKKAVRIVFDVDDAIYVTKNDNSRDIARVANYVICGNNTLKEYYEKYNKNTVVIPTVENTLNYIPYWSDTYDNKIIGWIGSKTTLDNFDLIIDALNTVTSLHPEVKIAIISNTALDYLDRIKNSYLVPWSQDTYISEIGKFTIGIMPLKDNEFNRGKCGFKLIQCLNMKKPVVGSGVGVNADIIEGNGIVANNSEEWIKAFEKLLFDKDIYMECVQHIEQVFFDRYHFSNVADRLIGILKG